VPGTEVKLIAKDGHALAPGETGELCIRGPQVMQGYWHRPKETTEVLCASGWLKTGDMAYVDTDGYLHIADRIADYKARKSVAYIAIHSGGVIPE